MNHPDSLIRRYVQWITTPHVKTNAALVEECGSLGMIPSGGIRESAGDYAVEMASVGVAIARAFASNQRERDVYVRYYLDGIGAVREFFGCSRRTAYRWIERMDKLVYQMMETMYLTIGGQK